MICMDFTTLEDLKLRIEPALKNRVNYFKKLGINDITEEDIFSYFFNSCKNKKDLSLSEIVNDILNCNYLNIRYYKERVNYEKRGY